MVALADVHRWNPQLLGQGKGDIFWLTVERLDVGMSLVSQPTDNAFNQVLRR